MIGARAHGRLKRQNASRNIDAHSLQADAILGKPFEVERFLETLRTSLPRSA